MLLQLDHAVLQPAHVLHHARNFGTNEVGGLAHAGVLEDLLHHLDRQHQQRRRHDDDPGAVGLLHEVVEAVIKLGIDGFRRHEHQRHVLGLAGQQVFLGNVGNVLPHVLAQALGGPRAVLVGLAFAQRGDRFERELGVDDERALIGQEDHAVRPGVVGQGVLERIERLGQRVLDDGLHARLAEGAAGLLVAEHVAQRDDLAGQFREVLLGMVEHRDALVEALQPLPRSAAWSRPWSGRSGSRRHRAAPPPPGQARPAVRQGLRPAPGAGPRSRPGCGRGRRCGSPWPRLAALAGSHLPAGGAIPAPRARQWRSAAPAPPTAKARRGGAERDVEPVEGENRLVHREQLYPIRGQRTKCERNAVDQPSVRTYYCTA